MIENNVMEVIRNRRSVRSFKPDQIQEEALETVLEAGKYAPSGHNGQGWNFTVIQDRSRIDRLNRAAKEVGKTVDESFIRNFSENPDLDIFYGAPTVILVSGDNGALTPMQDCSAATQNMLLAAESIGLGGCWNAMVGMAFNGSEKEQLIEELGIPEGYTPYHAIALGHKAGNGAAAGKRKENSVQYIR